MERYKTSRSVVTALRAGSLCLLVAGSALAADSPSSAEISASVTVLADDGCAITVGKADHPMEMTWTRKDGASAVDVRSVNAPVYVTVTATGGDSCHLSTSMKLRTVSTDMGDPTMDDFPSYRKNFGSKGGFWRVMPYLANAIFYTDEAASVPGAGKISWDGPTLGDENVTFGGEVANHAGEKVNNEGVGSGEFVFMTDQYAESGGALLIDDGQNEGGFSSDKSDEAYKSAKIGFGALIATDPESTDGTRNPDLASAADQVTMSWMVYIDQA
ncbi:hypothetical protein ACB496_15285 [Lelliottia nimipressuralis]|uniref:hypothetical protein n=1 Tax=Lelliottia nimipressuralis TaxID=69220 RepID=UPI0035577ADD